MKNNMKNIFDFKDGNNALVEDSAEVYKQSEVFGNAKVIGEAQIHDTAQVFGNASTYLARCVMSNTHHRLMGK